jgi:undecaprenyl phosphate-alpha-L-ara4N flippase subunit ArnE
MTNVILTLLFAMIMGAGQLVLSQASKEVFALGGLSINTMLASKWLWLGIFIYGCAMLFWVYILSRFDVKYAYPISSTAIFFTVIFQAIIERHMPSGSYWLGLVLVVMGLVVLSIDKKV